MKNAKRTNVYKRLGTVAELTLTYKSHSHVIATDGNRCIAGIRPGAHNNLYAHTRDAYIGATRTVSSAKFGRLAYRGRQGIGGSIRTGLSQFDIPLGATGIAYFGSVDGSVSGSADW